MDNDLDLSALRAFRAVVREGSFSAAALLLRVPKSTLSKRVADLETRLGVCGFREVPDSNYGKSRTRISVSPGQGFR